MALIFADRVRETTTTTGTGAFSLGGAVTGYRTFSSVMVNTDTTYYACAGQGTSEWEVGIGTWNTGNTLSRTTILASSNGGSAVVFSAGTKDIFITYAAGKTVIQDASGNVGIGTASPGGSATARQLTVFGTTAQVSASVSAFTANFGNNGTVGYVEATGANPFAFYTNSTERARITSGGNLLVGTTTAPTTGGFTDTRVSIKQIADGASGGGLHIEQNSNTNVAFFGFTGSAFRIGTSYRSAGSSYQPIEFSTSGATALTIATTGSVTAATDVRAPIFYDSNNTGYYGDFASTSVINLVQFGPSNVYIQASGTASDRNLKVRGAGSSSDIGIAGFDYADNWRFQLYASSSNYGFLNGHWAGWDLQKTVSGNLFMNGNNSYYLNAPSDNFLYRVYGAADIRSPIFYDYNDTAYYGDFASTSNINALSVATINNLNPAQGVWHTSAEGKQRFFFAANSTTYYRTGQNFVWRNNADSGVATLDANGWLRVASGGDNFASYQLHVDGTGYASSDFRAPIFYDSNDTNYYGDFASNSKLYTLEVNGANANASSDATLYVSATSSNDWGISLIKASWEYGIRYNLAATHTYGIYGQKNGTDYFRVGTDQGYHSASFRAPIFYDSDNTAYYGDFTSNSVFNTIYARNSAATNWKALYSSNYGYSTSYGALVIGDTSGNLTPCINVDPIGNASGSFGGTGGEVMFRNGVYFISPNSANNSYNQYLRMVDGYVQFTNNARAPIFYDSDNTSYYGDFASSSYLNNLFIAGTIRNNGSVADDDSFGLYFDSGASSSYAIYRGPGAWTSPYPDLRIGFHTGIQIGAYSSYGGIRFYDNDDMVTQVMSVNNSADGAGGGNVYVNNSLVAGSSLRAPIFYDSNNTAYYGDFASTSVVNQINMAGYLRRTTSAAGYLEGYYGTATDGNSSMPIYTIGGSYQPGTTSLGNMYGVGYTVGNGTSNPGLGMTGWGFYVASNGTSRVFLDSDNGIGVTTGSWRAPIFYDRDNTGYYLDPSSGSYLYGLVLSGNSYFRPNNWIQLDGVFGLYWPSHYGLHVRANDLSTYTQLAIQGSKGGYGGIFDYASSVNVAMYDGSGNGGVYREANSRWFFYYQVGNDCMGIGTSSTNSTYGIYCNKGAYLGGRTDVTILYDANNTGYYLDPASTSELNKVYYNSNMVSRNYGIGQVGLYASTRYQAVFAMGESYILPADGTTTGTLYGIAWSHPNAGGAAANLASHGMLILENGGFQGAWGGGSLRTPADVRGTLFYDYSNTSFYCDPASTSVVNNVQITTLGVGTAASGTTGEIRATNNITAYYSDERLKTRLGLIDNALDKLLSLEGFYYEANEVAQALGYTPVREVGVSAQAVQKILPEIVVPAPIDDKYLTVRYEKLVPLLIEAIKELSAKVDELQKRN